VLSEPNQLAAARNSIHQRRCGQRYHWQNRRHSSKYVMTEIGHEQQNTFIAFEWGGEMRRWRVNGAFSASIDAPLRVLLTVTRRIRRKIYSSTHD
jgi:hypothetical protein